MTDLLFVKRTLKGKEEGKTGVKAPGRLKEVVDVKDTEVELPGRDAGGTPRITLTIPMHHIACGCQHL